MLRHPTPPNSMKPLHLQFSSPRSIVARLSFAVAACVAAAAIGVAAPQRIPSFPKALSEKAPQTPKFSRAAGQGAVPPSLSKHVQVMIELDAPPAAALYAQAYEAAQTQAAALQSTQRAPLAAAQTGALPKIEVAAAAVARVQGHHVATEGTKEWVL